LGLKKKGEVNRLEPHIIWLSIKKNSYNEKKNGKNGAEWNDKDPLSF
jgi:hypothetical protein